MNGALADNISELANKPAVEDYDVEDVFEHGAKTTDDDESSIEDEASRKTHYVHCDRSKLRRLTVELDARYQGVKGSRESASNKDDGRDTMEGMIDSEDESDSVSFSADSENEQAQIPLSQKYSHEGHESGNQGDGQDDHQHFATLMQAERKRAVNNISENIKRDASKGFAILEQSKLFDNIIEVRMKLQNAMANINKLPATEDSWSKSSSSSTEKTLKHTIELLNRVMAEMVNFRKEFQTKEQISENSSTKVANRSKRSFEELTEETQGLDDQLRQYRSLVLHKWSGKISAASGASALKNSKFKAINQPANVQVENQLADVPRLLKRTRLNRKCVKPIRFEEDRVEGKLQDCDLDSEKLSRLEDADELDIPGNYDPRRKSAIDLQENPYIFDDEDFYKILLNDLVDAKINNAKLQSSGGQISITSRPTKLKKDVDTKASKGRKLNYSVQDSIAHYETPRNVLTRWSDEQIDEFFAGLLGQKVNFNETTDIPERSEDDDAIENDDVQIFG